MISLRVPGHFRSSGWPGAFAPWVVNGGSGPPLRKFLLGEGWGQVHGNRGSSTRTERRLPSRLSTPTDQRYDLPGSLT